MLPMTMRKKMYIAVEVVYSYRDYIVNYTLTDLEFELTFTIGS